MSGSGVVFRIESSPSLRGVGGRFQKATEQMIENAEKTMDSEGARYVGLAQDEAPKRTGEFADNISYTTTVGRGPGGTPTVGFETSTPQPLGRFIILGTKAHPIPTNPTGVAFFWPNAPFAPNLPDGRHFFRQVQHPGTKPDPFHGRAFRRWLPGARGVMSQIAGGFTRDLAVLIGSNPLNVKRGQR